jgi:hypothetical protein
MSITDGLDHRLGDCGARTAPALGPKYTTENAMNDYMVMFEEDEAVHARASVSELSGLISSQAAYTQALKESGVWRDGERLRPVAEAKRLRAERGQVFVQDGPFQGSATLASCCVVQAESLEKALEQAKVCPQLERDVVEVRPVMKGELQPQRTSKPGKIFAFAVLGTSSNEAGWVETMDRIDADTNDHFPEDSFVGGVRLEAPSAGRRIVTQRGQPVVLDGPFLEGKEVIGGMFFMRLPSIDDAVRWAATTAFARLGTLEIREVWRS